MLLRYETVDGFVVIPRTSHRYSMNMFGVVNDDSLGNAVPVVYCGNIPSVVLEIDGVDYTVGILSLLGIVFKNCRAPVEVWPKLASMPLDGNNNNLHPSNHIWECGLYRLNWRQCEFRAIPGFSRYAINRDGTVMNLLNYKILSSYVAETGYRLFGITPDVGKRTIVGQHRLLALAFIRYGVDVCDLDVNHLDGNKLNNNLLNLEWATRTRNNLHAVASGLAGDNHVVEVRDILTGVVTEYFSIEECGRRLGVDGETVRLRLASNGSLLFRPGLQYRRKSVEPWPAIDDVNGNMNRAGLAKPITVTSEDGNVKQFNSVASAASVLGLPAGNLYYHFKTKNKFKFNQYLFEVVSISPVT